MNKQEKQIIELRERINKFREISIRYPEHDGFKTTIRKLETEIADITEQLFKKKSS